MKDEDCIIFLQWCLPELGYRWPGYRKVRRQVCKRIDRRLRQLGVPDFDGYREYLKNDSGEWKLLDTYCRIPISRFYRDRSTFDYLRGTVLPELIEEAARRGDREFLCWSAGCASGEEPYTISLIWHLGLMSHGAIPQLRVIASDIDPHLVARAESGCYRGSSLLDLPVGWRDRAFTHEGDEFYLNSEFRTGVDFALGDIRTWAPDALFHLILCRNVAFTYFDERAQRKVLQRLKDRLRPGGVLVIGKHEKLPENEDLQPVSSKLGIYRKSSPP